METNNRNKIPDPEFYKKTMVLIRTDAMSSEKIRYNLQSFTYNLKYFKYPCEPTACRFSIETDICGSVAEECGRIADMCERVGGKCGDVIEECGRVADECEQVAGKCGDVAGECGGILWCKGTTVQRYKGAMVQR